jgi:hypothetical protein
MPSRGLHPISLNVTAAVVDGLGPAVRFSRAGRAVQTSGKRWRRARPPIIASEMRRVARPARESPRRRPAAAKCAGPGRSIIRRASSRRARAGGSRSAGCGCDSIMPIPPSASPDRVWRSDVLQSGVLGRAAFVTDRDKRKAQRFYARIGTTSAHVAGVPQNFAQSPMSRRRRSNKSLR